MKTNYVHDCIKDFHIYKHATSKEAMLKLVSEAKILESHYCIIILVELMFRRCPPLYLYYGGILHLAVFDITPLLKSSSSEVFLHLMILVRTPLIFSFSQE